jgi:hypothetical protein
VLECERAALCGVAGGEDEGECEGGVEGCEFKEAEDGVAGYACEGGGSVLSVSLEVCMSRERFLGGGLEARRKTYLRARACTRFGWA